MRVAWCKRTLLVGAIVSVASAMCLSAQDSSGTSPATKSDRSGDEGSQGEAGKGNRPPKPPLELALDANRDGTIDADEIAGAVAALKKLDKNGDGKLTPDEYRPPRPPREDGRGPSGGPGGEGPGRGAPPSEGAK
jgi:hypothetical protein